MISVIIPTYNCERYISYAINSVVTQTYKAYEIIVIDDGSTDNTRSLINNRYPSVRYHRLENKGAAAARNYGIKMAKGNLIAFLDADDIWMPQKLERQVRLFDSDDKASMIFTENSSFDENGIIKSEMNKRRKLMLGDMVRNIFLNSYVTTSSVMVKKSVFDSIGMFEENLAIAEDDNMWMRIAMEHKVMLLDEPLVLYRVRQDNLCSNYQEVIKGVIKNIDLLGSKYPHIFKRVGHHAVRRKYSVLHFYEGYQSFCKNDYETAKLHLMKSIGHNPWQIKTLIYLLACYVPQPAINTIKQIKHGKSKQPETTA